MTDLYTHYTSKTKLPALKQYKPPIADKSLSRVAFSPNPARRALCEHLNFVFLTKEELESNEKLVRLFKFFVINL